MAEELQLTMEEIKNEDDVVYFVLELFLINWYAIFIRKINLNKEGNKMLTIQEKAVKYAKKVEGSFLVRSQTNSVTCWNGNTTTVVGLRIEIVKNFKKEETHDEYVFDGVKIYIENKLILKENAYIYIFAKIPFMKPFFNAKGIETKKY